MNYISSYSNSNLRERKLVSGAIDCSVPCVYKWEKLDTSNQMSPMAILENSGLSPRLRADFSRRWL
jgi:hypothetical protein